MKAVIFRQVWYDYMAINIITYKVISIKAVDLKTNIIQKYYLQHDILILH